MMRALRAALAAVVATGVVAAGAVTATVNPPRAQAATTVTSCSGVWVVVDFGSLGGGVHTKCATKYSTGTAALKSAGFKVTKEKGFIYKINGKPSNPDISEAYWSYWHATKKSDGTFSAWAYSNKGADNYRPKKGNAEGWRYQALADGKVAPTKLPPRGYAKQPVPKISGTAKVGKILTVKTGTWSPKPTFGYQWYRSGTKIKGATTASYKLVKKDANKKIKVKVTAKGSGLQTVSKTSKAVKVKK